MSRINLDIGPISRVQAVERAIEGLLTSTIVGTGGALVTGTAAQGFRVSVPFANAFEFVAYDATKAVTSATVKTETDLKLNRAAKASGAEAIAGTDLEKWINPYSLKQAMNARIVEVAASDNPDLTAIQEQIDDRMSPDFANATFDETGGSGAARVNLANVNPFVGRRSLGQGQKSRSAEDISTGLSSSAYATAMQAHMQAAFDEGGEFVIPANTFSLARGLEFENVGTIRAHPSSLMICATNEPNFTFHMTAGHDGGGIYGLRAANAIGTLANTNAFALRFLGDCGGGAGVDAGLLEHFDLDDISTIGMYGSVDMNIDTYTTPHGEESRYNNSQVKNIRSLYSPGVLNAKYGLLRRQGSGTGVGLKWLTGNIARTASIPEWDTDTLPAHIRDMAGAGVVVGDVTYEVGQVTAYQAAAYSVDMTANYLSRVKLFAGQIDAQARFAVRCTGSGVNPVTYWDIDVGLGGGARLISNPPMFRSSRIVNRADDVLPYSVDLQNLPGGTNSILLATIDLAPFDATFVSGNVAGVVQGLAGGIFQTERLVSAVASVVSSQALSENTQGTSSPDFFKLTYTPNGRTMEIRLAYAAPASGSTCRVNISAAGGTRRLTEIPYP